MTVTEKAITDEMIDIFTGGRGFGLYYLWQAITPQTKWNDPDNVLIISPGPLAGNPQYAGSGKSLVVTLSPMTGIPIDCNVGGYFGPLLKFCGFDAVEIRGKAKNDVVVVIDGPAGLITIEEAPEETPDSHIAAELFTHMYADEPEGHAERVGGLGRQGRRVGLHGLPELLVVRPEARRGAPEAGRAAAARARSSATRSSRRWSCAARRWART